MSLQMPPGDLGHKSKPEGAKEEEEAVDKKGSGSSLRDADKIDAEEL